MPFEVPGGGPLNPSGRGTQGNTFEEQPIEDAGNEGQSSMFADAASLFEENEAAKKPFKMKPVLFAAGALALAGVLIFVLIRIFSSGGGQRGVSDMLEDAPEAPVVETGDGWESAEGGALPVPEPQPIAAQYTAEQLGELRAYGYTGDEIDAFQSEGTDYEALIEDAIAKQAQQQIKTHNYLLINSLASTDEAYKEALSLSWLGLPIPDVEPGEYDALGNPMSEYYSEQHKENVNYWKVPLSGNQCLLKLLLEDGNTVFYVTTPMDYLEKKKDYGNMVITYKRISYRGSYYVTDISEIEI
jgi:hypothetical protein